VGLVPGADAGGGVVGAVVGEGDEVGGGVVGAGDGLDVAVAVGRGDVVAVGLGDVFGIVGDADGEPGLTVPVHATPPSAKFVGAEPEPDPMRPRLTDAPVPSVPLYAALRAVTRLPSCVTVAFHACVTVSLEGAVQVSVHDVTAAPRLVTSTAAW